MDKLKLEASSKLVAIHAAIGAGVQVANNLYDDCELSYKVGDMAKAGALFGGGGSAVGHAISGGMKATGRLIADYSWARAPLSLRLMATSNALSGLNSNLPFSVVGTSAGNVSGQIVANANQ